MKRKITLMLLSAAACLFTSSTAFAGDELVGYCEGAACECDTESCTTASFDQLPKADSLKQLGGKFGVHTTYDSANDVYEVTVDVTTAPGEGIIVIDENSDPGLYDSVADFYDAVSEVLGTSRIGLPTMQTIDETGTELALTQTRFECTEDTSTSGGPFCYLQEGLFYRRRDQIADSIEVDAVYFNTTNPTSVSETSSTSANDETEVTDEMTGQAGTCARGEANLDLAQANTATREGEYLSSNSLCAAVEN